MVQNLNLAQIVKSIFGSAFTLSRGYIPGHDGVDLAAKEGTPIYAVASGTVEYARNAAMDTNCGAAWACGGGNVVNINIGSQKVTQYAHMSRMVVAKGATVQKGQLIGYVGQTGNATGPHLHFGLWDKAEHSMVNPTSFLMAVKDSNTLPQTGNLVGAWGDLVVFPAGHILTAADVDSIIAKLKAADARGSGCVAENRVCFFAGQSGLAGAQGEAVVRQILMSHVGQAWDKPLQETLAGEFGSAANEANAVGAALGEIGGTITKVATYGAGLVLLVVGLYLYSRGGSGG